MTEFGNLLFNIYSIIKFEKWKISLCTFLCLWMCELFEDKIWFQSCVYTLSFSFTLATQPRAQFCEFLSFVNIHPQEKSAGVWCQTFNDVKLRWHRWLLSHQKTPFLVVQEVVWSVSWFVLAVCKDILHVRV